MLAAQSSAAIRIAPLPRIALRLVQSKAVGLKSVTRPIRPTLTPMIRRAVSRSPRKSQAPGTTHSGVV